MEEPVQQELQQEPLSEQPDLDNEISNEDQGDIRRRLRDRDLLKKRKAEVEEKETDQWDFGTESPRKRGRSGVKRGRRRGRPRKPEPAVISENLNETALDQDSTVTNAVLDQTPSFLEAEIVSTAPPAAGSVFEQLIPISQAPLFTSEPAVDTSAIQVGDVAPAPEAVPLPVSPATQEPPLVQAMHSETQNKPTLNRMMIEDLRPEEEDDFGPTEQQAEDLGGIPKIIPEPTVLSTLTLSSQPSQEYAPGN